jgi:hypothetical protein
MSEICDKLAGCTDNGSTRWSAISAESQVGLLGRVHNGTAPALGLTKIDLHNVSKSGAFFGPHPEIGEAITDWTKQAATAIGNYVQEHPYRTAAGIAVAALTHRLGGDPITSAGFGSIVAINPHSTYETTASGLLGPTSTSIDLSSVKNRR